MLQVVASHKVVDVGRMRLEVADLRRVLVLAHLGYVGYNLSTINKEYGK